MAYPIVFNFTPAATSANGLANDAVYTGGVLPLTASSAADNLAHIITVLNNSATDHSGKTFTVTGTDAEGNTQSEALTGPTGNATISTTLYFKTVTSVAVSATTGADTFDVGWTAVAISALYPIDWRQRNFQVATGVYITGTINYTVQHTLTRLYPDYQGETPPTRLWYDDTYLSAKTASADSNYAYPVTASRLKINSVSTGATAAWQIVQGL